VEVYRALPKKVRGILGNPERILSLPVVAVAQDPCRFLAASSFRSWNFFN
jgi:hypothetical protein